MNVDTGHLVDIQKLAEELSRESKEELERSERDIINMLKAMGYKKVPTHLQAAAERKLAGRTGAHVSLNSNTELSRWAREERIKRLRARAKKRKNRRKMAKESRRKNR